MPPETAERAQCTTSQRSVIARVCKRIPPLWDLSNYVAVNPFLGFAETNWLQAARTLSDGLDAKILPGTAYYQSLWERGALEQERLLSAAKRHGFDPDHLMEILSGRYPLPVRASRRVLTMAERHDEAFASNWSGMVHASICRWCAVWAADGGSTWTGPASQGLYASWRGAAQIDRTLEIAGLAGWRRWIAELPECPHAATERALTKIAVDYGDEEAYLYRLLGGVYGWASYFRRESWERGDEAFGALAELLAVCLCADAAVLELAPKPPVMRTGSGASVTEDEYTLAVFQEAAEDSYVGGLLRALNAGPFDDLPSRPGVQAAFCIDVRSERLRRHLEAQSSTLETIGFAGFFGIALDWRHGDVRSARCPVLLKPSLSASAHGGGKERAFASAAKHLQYAPSAAFSFVEILGLGYGIRLAQDLLGKQGIHTPQESRLAFTVAPAAGGDAVGMEQRVETAAAILRNMGLVHRFARLVLLCGHEGHSENNPHAAGLDCGACGGHGGAINARVAVALLNDPCLRTQLRARGIAVPTDTLFVAGVHDTATDCVHLLDMAQVPESHRAQIEQLRAWLEAAGARTRQERAPALGLSKYTDDALLKQMKRRARDWSETRPEWGLARNAAFIAARRARTRDVHLDGRAFLHDYDWRADGDSAILGLILSAPMVVASWINLQYFASTVDNDVLGSGNKTLHNRVDMLGVVLGNGGDLRTGLPLQSVHGADGAWYHEPLRLQVVVEAPTEKLDSVLEAHQVVRDLIENGWVRLFALAPNSDEVAQWVPGLGWEPFHVEAVQ